MGDRERYRRPSRGIQNRRQPPPSDSIWRILVMQLLLCAAIVGGIAVLKLCAPELYGTVRSQCDRLLNQSLPQWQAWQSQAVGQIQQALEEVMLLVDPMQEPPAAMGGMLQVDALTIPKSCTAAPIILTAQPIAPVEGTITSPFGFRIHPITGETDFHNGVDIAAPEGTAIHAALPGTVVETGESDIYGKYVRIEHSDTLTTTYNHCSKIIAQNGMVVRQGERVALVGSTGMATGPHVHFEIRVGGLCANPAWVMNYAAEG